MSDRPVITFSTQARPSYGDYLVIADDTGREVDRRDTLQEANGRARHLTLAAKRGSKDLRRALGAGRED